MAALLPQEAHSFPGYGQQFGPMPMPYAPGMAYPFQPYAPVAFPYPYGGAYTRPRQGVPNQPQDPVQQWNPAADGPGAGQEEPMAPQAQNNNGNIGNAADPPNGIRWQIHLRISLKTLLQLGVFALVLYQVCITSS